MDTDDDMDYYYTSSQEVIRYVEPVVPDQMDTNSNKSLVKIEEDLVPIPEYPIPKYFKWKEDMEVKDVLKEHTLPYLPAKILSKLRVVSKEWDEWIKSPFLALKQSFTFRDISGFFCHYQTNLPPEFLSLSKSLYDVPSPSLSFLPDKDFVIRSSSNGLLLCQGINEFEIYYICNPAVKEYVTLPKTEYFHRDAISILEFEPSVLNMAPNYRVISAVKMLNFPILDFDVYSSETKKWKRSSADCIELGDETVIRNGFYIKGISYWLTSNHALLAFDLSTELCGIMYLPIESARDGIVAEINGEVCYICAQKQSGKTLVFDFYSGMDMSLKRSVIVNVELEIWSDKIHVLAFINDGVLYFYVRDTLFSYQMGDEKAKSVLRKRKFVDDMRFLPYVNSLVNVTKLDGDEQV